MSALCTELLAQKKYAPDDCVVRRVALGLPFARDFWHALAGELLLLGCEDMPLFQTAPATLCCLLAPERHDAGAAPRSQFAPIEQVHFGSCDLRFGGAFFRPEHAGHNDTTDVARLLGYLETIDPATWTEEMLRPMAEFPTAAEREEELAFARDWRPVLVELYAAAARHGDVIVCERT